MRAPSEPSIIVCEDIWAPFPFSPEQIILILVSEIGYWAEWAPDLSWCLSHPGGCSPDRWETYVLTVCSQSTYLGSAQCHMGTRESEDPSCEIYQVCLIPFILEKARAWVSRYRNQKSIAWREMTNRRSQESSQSIWRASLPKRD